MKPLTIALLLLAGAGAAQAAQANVIPGGLCAAAIEAAEIQHATPKGLLYAIGQVESGRADPLTHRAVPWPWSVQAQGQSYYFATEPEAVAWVQAAELKGIQSIDVGCMQVNLMYHPTAFRNLDEAFDPGANADYAARFLVSLHAETGDWQKAAGLYHSQTLALAVPYAQKVEDALNGKPFAGGGPPPKPTMLALLQSAWGATLDSSAATSSEDETALEPGGLAEPRPRNRFHHARLRQTPILLSYEH